MSDLEKTLLAGIRRELARLAAVKVDGYGHAAMKLAIRDAKAGILAIDLTVWLGHHPGDAERKAAHRALARLEEAGILERIARWGGRATHVRLS